MLLALPAASAAKPPSFALWLAHFSARVQRDVTHIGSTCQKRFGHDDARVGRCFVRAERRTLRAEQAAWEKGIARTALHQRRSCRKAIAAYRRATRRAAKANLVYLDSHRRSRSHEDQPRSQRRALRDAQDRHAEGEDARRPSLRLARAIGVRLPAVSRAAEEQNRSLARARNAMVRTHAEPLYLPAPVRIARVSEER